MNKHCAGCGRPVYFAERKTSLGREWHPSCLKCVECGKVLSPGQHAEHKGMPYCHHPCYRALYGPAILGYGSNISSPANFAPRRTPTGVSNANNPNRASTGNLVNSPQSGDITPSYYSLGRRNRTKHHLVHHNSNGVKKEIIKQDSEGDVAGETVFNSPIATSEFFNSTKRQNATLTPTAYENATLTPTAYAQGSENLGYEYVSTAATSSPSLSSSIQHRHLDDSVHDSAFTQLGSKLDAEDLSPHNEDIPTRRLQDMLQKLAEFNRYYEGKVHNHMTANQRDDGSVGVEGPLRIYWGLSRPIQLAHYDNIPPAPISQWRHSLHVGANSPANSPIVEAPNRSFASMSLRRTGSPARKSRELDDLLSPTSPDDVVRRKKAGVRKFKTVAYRGGDQPSKWKRASINGHIFNFDTSVFTPVLGSCTSVTVDGTYTATDVIETLLDKFKVQNSADEYVLSIVNEEGERLLANKECPLLERLKIGPDETVGKIFIKEREVLQENGVGELVVDALSCDSGVVAIVGGEGEEELGGGGGRPVRSRSMRSSSIKMPIRETEEEENLPHEVEQLLVLPEAVLKGLLVKYHNDEEMEVRKVRARYEVVKQRMIKTLHEVLNNSTSSTA